MTISVIIPTYNAGNYLLEAIESVMIQKKELSVCVEIIVSDDGSTDSSCDFLPCGVILIRNSHKCAASARNKALDVAKGDYIMFLDADDRLTEKAISSLFAEMNHNERCDAVFSKAQDFISDELTEEEKRQLMARELPYSGILPGCALLKREVFDKVGCFDESLSSGETVSWMMSFREYGFLIKTIEEVTLLRRIHMNNTGRNNKSQEIKNYATAIRQKLLTKNNLR